MRFIRTPKLIPRSFFCQNKMTESIILKKAAPEEKPKSRSSRKDKQMRAIVIYTSQTGFTKRYAQWIADAAGGGCLELSEAKKKDLTDCDAIIFGGWACAGGISGLGWFKRNLDKWADKKLIVFCVGASPENSPEIAPALRRNFTESEWNRVSAFYCPGGLNYEKMSLPSRLMMKMFLGTLKAKKEKSETDAEMIKIISASYDISDRKYIEPILECLGN